MIEPNRADPDIIVRHDDFPAWMVVAAVVIVAGLMVVLWVIP